MNFRKISQIYPANPTQDGAGVKMNRLFYRKDTLNMDPFLMLDIFDTKNPVDYLKGFPIHPHRGIQTLTYLLSGEINHKDSLGNVGTIKNGQYQWMNSGSGIMHEEMPQEHDEMLGFQLWINLAAKDKMSDPAYYEGKSENIPVLQFDNYQIRLLSGEYSGISSTDLPAYIESEIYIIEIDENATIDINVKSNYNVFIANMRGEIVIDEKIIDEKTGIILSDGEIVRIKTLNEKAIVLFFAGEKLNEPIAWGGPIVMNTKEELIQANKDLATNNFIKHEAKFD